MPDTRTASWTLDDAARMLKRASVRLDFYAFVDKVLERKPNINDVWQMEKWEQFQELARGASRMPVEMIAAVIATETEKGY